MLDERKLNAVMLKAQGVDVTKIAETVGISRQTYYNWEKDEEFKAELDRLRQEFLTQAHNITVYEGIKSAKKLAYLRDHAKSEKVQLDASAKLLDKVVSNATRIDINTSENDTDRVNDDILEKEFSEIDSEE